MLPKNTKTSTHIKKQPEHTQQAIQYTRTNPLPRLESNILPHTHCCSSTSHTPAGSGSPEPCVVVEDVDPLDPVLEALRLFLLFLFRRIEALYRWRK